MTTRLQLEAGYVGPQQWSWRLRYDPQSGVFADGEVDLRAPGGSAGPVPPASAGFEDWLAAEVTSSGDGPASLDEGRQWLGRRLLPGVGPAIYRQRPALVNVIVPKDASSLLSYPLELAQVEDPDRPGGFVGLAEAGVLFHYEINNDSVIPKEQVTDALRVLAIFSEPLAADGAVSRLARERVALVGQIDRLAREQQKSIELRTLTYESTRSRLQDCLQEHAGWDIVHVSGYGLMNGLSLRGEEVLSMRDFAEELREVRTRLKAITLVDHRPSDASHFLTAGQQRVAIAAELAAALDCTVAAFRRPACDRFADRFVSELFAALAGQKQQPLFGAVRVAASAVANELARHGRCTARCGQLCGLLGPFLVGSAAAFSLPLVPPRRPDPLDFSVEGLKTAFFPARPTGSMAPMTLLAAAADALRPDAAERGVVIVGPHEAARSAAIELAYESMDNFVTPIWHDIFPSGPAGQSLEPDSAVAFDALVRTLDQRLPRLGMARQAHGPAELGEFAAKLSVVFKQHNILLVITDLDLLLTETGGWRDERWEILMSAFLCHEGDSRVIFSSSWLPPERLDSLRIADLKSAEPGADEEMR